MKHSFIFRLYKRTGSSCLECTDSITISGITLIVKDDKFSRPRIVLGNCKKFGYICQVSGKLTKVAGSNSYPELYVESDYIDIKVINFPRYPCLSQDKYKYTASNLKYWDKNGFRPDTVSNGYDTWTAFRKFEFITI